MSSLKMLRMRMSSIKSTSKMTQAMKLVSASKLRKSKEILEGGKPYFEAIEKTAISMLLGIVDRSEHPIAFGRLHEDNKVQLVVFGSDKGLCGSFNVNLAKKVRADITSFQQAGITVEIICSGNKVYELLKPLGKEILISTLGLIDRESLKEFVLDLQKRFNENLFDSCYVYYNHFISAIVQETLRQRLIPLFREEDILNQEENYSHKVECLPAPDTLIAETTPKILLAKIMAIYQESQASENGARMASMDNATRNAGDMLKKLNTIYNRTRQAAVTTELIEILAGAEAIKSN